MKSWAEIKRKKFSEEKCREIYQRAQERVQADEDFRISPKKKEKEGKYGQQDKRGGTATHSSY